MSRKHPLTPTLMESPGEHVALAIVDVDRIGGVMPAWWGDAALAADWLMGIPADNIVLISGLNPVEHFQRVGVEFTDVEVGGWQGASPASMPRVSVVGVRDGLGRMPGRRLWRGCFRWVEQSPGGHGFDVPFPVAATLMALMSKPGDSVFIPFGPVQQSLVEWCRALDRTPIYPRLDTEEVSA